MSFTSRFTILTCIIACCKGSLDPAIDCKKEELTKWEDYVCKLTNRTEKVIEPNCWPISFSADTEEVKGAVLIYHGYTACPDSVVPLAETLASLGFHVYAPLTVGHGRKYDTGCNLTGTVCVDKDPVDELPTTIEEYENFVTLTVDAFKEALSLRGVQPDTHVIGVTGLSLGGPLATYAMIEDSTFFSRGLNMNPFFGITVPPLDLSVRNCLGNTSNVQDYTACLNTLSARVAHSITNLLFGNSNGTIPTIVEESLQKILVSAIETILPDPNNVRAGYEQIQNIVRYGITRLVQRPDLVKALGLTTALDHGFGWGAGCIAQRNAGRYGYCNFQIKHLLAVHAFGQTSMALAYQINDTELASILVERDGFTRLSLSASVARDPFVLHNLSSTICVYRIDPSKSCEASNECGTPHSMLSHAENKIIPPGVLYWEHDLFDNIEGFFLGGDAVGTSFPSDTYVNRSQCESMEDIQELPSNLFGQVPVGGSLTLAMAGNSEFDLSQLASALATELQINNDFYINIMEDLVLDIPLHKLSQGGQFVIRVSFIKLETALELLQVLQNGLDVGIEGLRVVSLQVDGMPLQVNNIGKNDDSSVDDDGTSVGKLVAIIVGSIAGVALIAAISVAAVFRQKGQKRALV